MNNCNLLILMLCLLVTQAKTQNTTDLFSLQGLTIASNTSDDTGQIFRSTTFYTKDTVIDNKSYLEYQSKNCYSTFLRIDSFKVYEKDLLWNEEETLLYDFGLELGETIDVPLFIQPGGWMKINFYVISKETIVFLDGRDRIKLKLESDNWGGTLEWIEGVGQFNFGRNIECIKDDNGSIYLAISEDECNKVVCKSVRVDFDIETEDNKVTLTNRSENYDELEWDMGDGTIYTSEVVEHS